jgi:hypothetical protein
MGVCHQMALRECVLYILAVGTAPRVMLASFFIVALQREARTFGSAFIWEDFDYRMTASAEGRF